MKRNGGGSPYKIHYLEMHGQAWLTLEFSIAYKAVLCTLLCLSLLTEPCCGRSSTFPGLRGGKKTETQTWLGNSSRHVTDEAYNNVNHTVCCFWRVE